MTSMAGSPKARRNWISSVPGSMRQGKIIAWDFADRSFPLTAVSGGGMRLLASSQIGMKPTAGGNSNGTAGGGEMYAFENQKCAAPLIPGCKPTRLRCGPAICAPRAIWRAALPANRLWTRSRLTCTVDPVQFRLRYLGATSVAADALLRSQRRPVGKSDLRPRRRRAGPKATGRGVALSNRANTICGAVAEVEVDKSTGQVTVKRFTLVTRLRTHHQSRWAEKPDRGKYHSGRKPRAAWKKSSSTHRNQDFRLEHLPDHQISGCSRNRDRIDQPPGNAGPRRRRTVNRPDRSGHRQRDLRRHRCAAARGAIHAGAHAGRIEESMTGKISVVESECCCYSTLDLPP